ncbi:uncharacterized protein LOC124817580 [Hydra vulgaris]|uniref:Hexosyltransferase n=1 Tax=Hydra vulgaris TaxID=6087 RepID=A0ABM4CDJ7_HYDVU
MRCKNIFNCDYYHNSKMIITLIVLKVFVISYILLKYTSEFPLFTFFHIHYKPAIKSNVLLKQDSGGLLLKQDYLQSNSSWHKRTDKFDHLDKNIIYANFKIQRVMNRKHFNIIAIVSSAPTRSDRRTAIRDTWWTQCNSSSRVSIKCVFLTDWKDPYSNLGKSLLSEADIYNDMYFQNLTGGHDFGKRFLYHMVWSMQNFDYDYFLRLDDDYFVCMERFLYEVPMPPRKLYHWGWVHCIENLVRPEESIILLSRDIVEIFLGQDPEKILCNRWADQMIGIWNNILNLPKFYHHDRRLHHDPPARDIDSFRTKKNICTEFIGVHGSYPIQMRTLWQHRGSSNYEKSSSLDNYSDFCWFDSIMNWENFGPDWRVEPKLCKTDPDWGGKFGSAYTGREGN